MSTTYEQRLAKFQDFLNANPGVYERIVFFARQAKAAGAPVGMRLLIERLRWERAVEVKQTDDSFAINNDIAPFLARLVMEREVDLKDFFETRDREQSGAPATGPYVPPEQGSLFGGGES
jgi:hypothetical protein